MSEDLELIKQLGKKIGEKLEELKFYDKWKGNSFSMDLNGNVKELNLIKMKLKKIPLIS